MIVQLYEIQTPKEAEALVELGVDHIGSVVVSEKDWKIDGIYDTVRLIERSGQAKSSLIPLYSNRNSIFRTIDYYKPNIVHFCESLADFNGIQEGCKNWIDIQFTLKNRYPEIKIMRSIPLPKFGMSSGYSFLDLVRMFEPVSDYFLTDTILMDKDGLSDDRQPVSGFIGITGKTCNWDMAENLVQNSAIPVILAGGLSPTNVAAGILKVKPFGVDSCTLTNRVDVEHKPIRFQKDLELVKAFINKARETAASL